MEYSAKTLLPLNSIGIIHSLSVFRRLSKSWYNLSLIYYLPKGETTYSKGLYFTQSIRFWRFMPKGEKVLAQSKRAAPPPNFQNFLKMMNFSIGMIFNLLSHCVQKGECSVFKIDILKTLLNTKRRNLLRGSFV
jgi:hypothetical protein